MGQPRSLTNGLSRKVYLNGGRGWILFGCQLCSGRIITTVGRKGAFLMSTLHSRIIKRTPVDAADRSTLTGCRILL